MAVGKDGRVVLTGGKDHTARLWRIPPPVEGGPDRVMLWAEVVTRMKLDDNDSVRYLEIDDWNKQSEKLKAIQEENDEEPE